MPISLKPYNQIMKEMLDDLMNKVDIQDLESGSVLRAALEAGIEACIEAEHFNKRLNLIRFLAKLDGRFKKYNDPWSELKLAQRYFSSIP